MEIKEMTERLMPLGMKQFKLQFIQGLPNEDKAQIVKEAMEKDEKENEENKVKGNKGTE